jgi:hypothetical protein
MPNMVTPYEWVAPLRRHPRNGGVVGRWPDAGMVGRWESPWAPLENGVHVTGGAVLLSHTQVIDFLVGLVGLVILASGAGYLIGQRRRS